MSEQYALYYGEAFHQYFFGPKHPFHPQRLKLTIDLIQATDLIRPGELREPIIDLEDHRLCLVHSTDYVEAVRRASAGEHTPALLRPWGLDQGDTPAFYGMHEAAMSVVGTTLTAATDIMDGRLTHAFNPGGGLHHAQASHASGFCIYNDVAVAAHHIAGSYGAKVLYIDIDAHHGDGVQNLFYDRSDILTYSIHESGRFLFPGTGDVEEIGVDQGLGYSINLPMLPHTTDKAWLTALEQTLTAAAEAFKPDIIISQHGCDAHALDPLSHLALTTDAYAASTRLIHALAHEYCDGRWLATGGGGYDHWRVVPRAWTIVWATMTERSLPKQIPTRWLDTWNPISPQELPTSFYDDPSGHSEDDSAQASESKRVTEQVLSLCLPYLRRNTLS